jgi:hypothetical protein
MLHMLIFYVNLIVFFVLNFMFIWGYKLGVLVDLTLFVRSDKFVLE